MAYSQSFFVDKFWKLTDFLRRSLFLKTVKPQGFSISYRLIKIKNRQRRNIIDGNLRQQGIAKVGHNSRKFAWGAADLDGLETNGADKFKFPKKKLEILLRANPSPRRQKEKFPKPKPAIPMHLN
ncbi:MAG: hypothetical protein D6680_06790 [Cyanobacteria bacterium J007]|nr:MAG: hypothetical protein D6680_06790 [Cyanobacteria bacterium J007]